MRSECDVFPIPQPRERSESWTPMESIGLLKSENLALPLGDHITRFQTETPRIIPSKWMRKYHDSLDFL
jgi:hypothetical protein